MQTSLFQTDDQGASSLHPGVLRRGEITTAAGSGMPLGAGGLFGVIYADPPWSYQQKGVKGAAAKQYPLMTDDELCAMQIPAAKDCILYLWTTSPLLESGLRVMKAWGFSYKSQAVWDKMRTGIGFWWIGQHETLMVGVRGNVKPPPPQLRRSSVIRCPRGRHSAKPDQVRDWIAAWYPDVPRLEMFSRLHHPGWHSFGNQCEHDLLSGVGFEECVSEPPKGKDSPRHDATENDPLHDKP